MADSKNSNRSCGIGCLILLLAAFVMFFAYVSGTDHSDSVETSDVALWTTVALVTIAIVGYAMNKGNQQAFDIIKSRREQLNQVTAHFNNLVGSAQDSKHYNSLRSNYLEQTKAMKQAWDQADDQPAKGIKRFWKAAIGLGFAIIAVAGGFGLGIAAGPIVDSPMAALMDSRSWNAENIPMPHMQDHSLYLCNPDSIIAPDVERQINEVLGQLDDELGVESVMAIVGHIDNDDPVGMVRGIYDKYKVGRDDRGLVIVVGYLDHSYFIAPGRSLEADLTDAECDRLARQYLIPSMKAEQPDSGMLYLARGVLAKMSEKELPQMAALTSSSSEDSGQGTTMLLFPLIAAAWAALAARMGTKLGTSIGMQHLKGDPFYVYQSHDSSSGGRSSRGGSFGGGRSGGFGGGSWGGGGAGGRW